MHDLKNKIRITSIIIALISIMYVVIYDISNNVLVVTIILASVNSLLDLIPDNLN